MNFIKFLFLLSLSLITASVEGQDSRSSDLVQATVLENSSMTINGSSTLHDWSVEATEFTIQFRLPSYWFDSDENWTGEDITELNVTVPVDHLDGGRNKMNRDLRDALKFDEYPNIHFTWDELEFTDLTDTGRRAEVTGRVTIAGNERDIKFAADLSINEWSQIVVKGTVPMNMGDYDIEPPRALLGVIRTDEDIELSFELYFGKETMRD